MSQSYVGKAGDFFFRNSDKNNKVQNLSIFQNDAAEMCFEINALGAVLNSAHHFQDPQLLINVAIMDCKEQLTVVQYMLMEIFDAYEPESRYDIIIICGCNEYDESKGLFPGKLNTTKNRKCILCNKYGLQQSRIVRKIIRGQEMYGCTPK